MVIEEFSNPDEEAIGILFKPFKKVRQERQSPAHKISDNVYDKGFIAKQTELIKEVYFTMRTLRQIFQKHRDAKDVKPSKSSIRAWKTFKRISMSGFNTITGSVLTAAAIVMAKRRCKPFSNPLPWPNKNC